MDCGGIIPPCPLVPLRLPRASGATSTTLMQVPTVGDCTSGGWYYDDNTNPTKISLCPATCSAVQQDANANLKIELGCATVIL